ncbi:HD domain-containing protein [Ruminococcus sp. FC2018]|uniref:HD domain-containing protein n=1 Tax=Ruminococcus sp. FC2018 TaxID=1410617 RepID=UPI00048AFE0F|nr:HD domain-containing protein [Ruminococcus sp. FC2018]
MKLRYHKILKHKLFITAVRDIENKESDRIFCRHGMEHLFDVARIAYIMALEEGCSLSKDIIYATCLLHDIGRGEEYENGVSHNQAGAKTAAVILKDCGYDETEIAEMTKAIRTHGHDGYPKGATDLQRLLCTADKLSRLCFNCAAYDRCNWAADKRNETLEY